MRKIIVEEACCTKNENMKESALALACFLPYFNDLIKAHFHINVSYLINAPSTLLKCYLTSLS